MSQHILTVENDSGTKLTLLAGWDWPLRQFFLHLHYADKSPHDAGAVVWDSQRTIEGMMGYRNIGDVENTLHVLRIPFGDIDQNPQQLNRRLLPLLCEILTEQDGPRPALDQKRKNWNLEPEPAVISAEMLAIQERIKQETNKRYSLTDQHHTYTVAGWLEKNAGRREITNDSYNFWVRWCIINQRVVDTEYDPFRGDEQNALEAAR